MGEGLGGGEAGQLLGDYRMNTAEICQHLVVPEPQNAIALVLDERTSLGFLRRRSIVLTAVNFHDDSGLMACEVGYVAADRHLASEFVSLHLLRAEYLPDPTFRGGHISPQVASSRMGAECGVFLHVSVSIAGGITPSQPSPLEGEGSKAAQPTPIEGSSTRGTPSKSSNDR